MKNDSEFIDAFKLDVIHNVTKTLARSGGLNPEINVLAKHTVKKEFTVIIVPVPEGVLNSANSKDLFAKMIPTLFDDIYERGLEPLCYSWSSEAWLRKGNKNEGIPDNWQDLPKIEVLMTTFETKDSSIMDIYNIKREGKIANEDGNLIDCISLEKNLDFEKPDGEIEGRFGNVFKTYMQKREKER
jgi:hypothetical protein